jgi:hypothetical protein
VTFSNYNPVSSNTVPPGASSRPRAGSASGPWPASRSGGTFVLPNVIRRPVASPSRPSSRARKATSPRTRSGSSPGREPGLPEGQQPEPDRRRHATRRRRSPRPSWTRRSRSSRRSSTRPSRTRSPPAPAPPADTTLFPGPRSSAVRPGSGPEDLVGQASHLRPRPVGDRLRDRGRPAARQRDRDPAARGQDRRDHQLVEGSIDVEVGRGPSARTRVSFQATARAQRIDPGPACSARSSRARRRPRPSGARPYGAAKVSSGHVGLDRDGVRLRLDLTVQGPPGASAGPSTDPRTRRRQPRPSPPRAARRPRPPPRDPPARARRRRPPDRRRRRGSGVMPSRRRSAARTIPNATARRSPPSSVSTRSTRSWSACRST